MKHTNPCGVGQGKKLREAWDKAFATDRQAPFGGIITTNQTLDAACAEAISEIFSEVIVAPDFSAEALEILQKKKNLRLLRLLKSPREGDPFDVRSVGANSFLLQQRDLKMAGPGDLKIVTKRQPTPDELGAMLFGLARGQAREIKRHRLCAIGTDRGHWGRANEPGGCQPDRRLESIGSKTFTPGKRRLQ